MRLIRIISFIFSVCFWLSVTSIAHARPLEIGIAAFDVKGQLPNNETIELFEKKLGKPINTINWFMGFNADTNELPKLPLKELRKIPDHIIPMLTLEPWGETKDRAGKIIDPFRKLNAGKLDGYLIAFAREIKAFGRPLRFRFGHEMIQDDDPKTTFPSPQWYPWQDCPDAYKAAYKRIYRIFKKEIGDNIQFVWAPNFEPSNQNVLVKYYPGLKYVDWIGIDGYNWAGGDFDSIFKKIYFNLTTHPDVYGDKPIMLSEIGAGKQDQSKFFNKAQWIIDAIEKIKLKYPRVKVFYWFNVNKERDWRLDETPESWRAFKNTI